MVLYSLSAVNVWFIYWIRGHVTARLKSYDKIQNGGSTNLAVENRQVESTGPTNTGPCRIRQVAA